MNEDDIVELASQRAIETIEQETLAANIDLNDCARICRHVAKELQNRADMFEDEADGTEDD